MRRLLLLAVLLCTGCSLTGSDGDAISPEESDAMFEIVESVGQTEEEAELRGMAGASAEGEDKTRVVVSLDEPPQGAINAEIRAGDCRGQLGSVHYDLEDVVDGESSTVVDAPLQELLERGYVVFIGDWDREGQLCGDFFGAEEN
jgi:hypothetical protein